MNSWTLHKKVLEIQDNMLKKHDLTVRRLILFLEGN